MRTGAVRARAGKEANRQLTPKRKSPQAPAHDKALRQHLVNLLSGGGAHIEWKATFAGIPPKLRGVRPEGLPYSVWDLLEHMRIAQWDILEFSRDAKHVSPDWPAGYWPAEQMQPSVAAWGKSLRSFARDLEAMKKLVASPKTDLFAPIPHGTGQTVLREALLIADHNAYHLGQVLTVRRLLGNWI
jgi:DinB superfamily